MGEPKDAYAESIEWTTDVLRLLGESFGESKANEFREFAYGLLYGPDRCGFDDYHKRCIGWVTELASTLSPEQVKGGTKAMSRFPLLQKPDDPDCYRGTPGPIQLWLESLPGWWRRLVKKLRGKT